MSKILPIKFGGNHKMNFKFHLSFITIIEDIFSISHSKLPHLYDREYNKKVKFKLKYYWSSDDFVSFAKN